MRKKTLISLLFLMALCFTKAQNLVPNYSFENIIQCTSGFGAFNGYVADWTGQTAAGSGLAYYTHQCPGDSAGGGSVPYNYYNGFQYARTGVSYGSFVSFVTASITDTIYPYGKTSFANQRNYLQTELIDSLQTGVKYYVAFYVNLMNSCWYSCSDAGAYFSKTAPVFNSSGLVLSSYIPQIVNDPKKQELIDTLNWMKISGNFTAKGGEKYITIGNFKNDSLSSVRYLGQPTPDGTEAWYYIDDVIVSPDSAYVDSLATVSVQSISKPKEMTEVFPNPSTGVFTFNFSGNTEKSYLSIYNMLGENIYNTKFNTATTQIDLSGRPAGVYLYRIVSEKGETVGSGKLIIQ